MILQFYVFIKRKNVLETCESFHQNAKKGLSFTNTSNLFIIIIMQWAGRFVGQENGQIGIDSFIIIFQENFHHPY